METDGETVGLMLLEGQHGQKLYRHLSCCVMTLNHFLGQIIASLLHYFSLGWFPSELSELTK